MTWQDRVRERLRANCRDLKHLTPEQTEVLIEAELANMEAAMMAGDVQEDTGDQVDGPALAYDGEEEAAKAGARKVKAGARFTMVAWKRRAQTALTRSLPHSPVVSGVQPARRLCAKCAHEAAEQKPRFLAATHVAKT